MWAPLISQVTFILFFSTSTVFSQPSALEDHFPTKNTADSIAYVSPGSAYEWKQLIVPSVMVGYGIGSQFIKPLIRLDKQVAADISKNQIKEFPIEDMLQYFPTASVYAFDLFGSKPKHAVRDYTLVLASSHLIMAGIVQTMKHTIDVQRPNGKNTKSFPSGHTATAFVGAHVLFKEYKDDTIWLGISGYAFATFTGYMRIGNQKHWVSDVVAGAGIGILSVELAYWLLPSLQKWFGWNNTSHQLMILPSFQEKKIGLGLIYNF